MQEPIGTMDMLVGIGAMLVALAMLVGGLVAFGFWCRNMYRRHLINAAIRQVVSNPMSREADVIKLGQELGIIEHLNDGRTMPSISLWVNASAKLIGKVIDCWLNKVMRDNQQQVMRDYLEDEHVDLIFRSVAQTLQSFSRFRPRRVRALLKGMERHKKQGIRSLLIQHMKEIQEEQAAEVRRHRIGQTHKRALRAAHPQKKEKDPLEDLTF